MQSGIYINYVPEAGIKPAQPQSHRFPAVAGVLKRQ